MPSERLHHRDDRGGNGALGGCRIRSLSLWFRLSENVVRTLLAYLRAELATAWSWTSMAG